MSSTLIHDVRPRQALDLVILGIVFVVGVAGTAFLKFGELGVLLTAAYPVVILLLYVFACFFTRATKLEPDTVGDNCYYLGFLFTLTSLAITLYQIRDLTSQEGPMLAADVIPQVISGFGVALSSTIAGVALRVALMQMRPDIVARDREARADLTKAVRDFHTVLGQASRRMKESAVENSQYAAERNAKIDELTDRHATQINELISKQVGAFDALVHSAALGVDRQAAQMKELTDLLGAQVGELSLKQIKAFEALSQSAAQGVDRQATQTKDLTDRMATQMADLSAKQTRAIETLVQSAAQGADRQSAQMSELLARQSKAFESAIHATIEKMSDALIAKIGGETLRAVETLNDATGQLASVIGRVAQTQEEGMPRLRAAQKGVEAALEGWRDSITGQQMTSGKASQALTDQTAALVDSAQAHHKAFDDAAKTLAQEVASVVSTLEAQKQVTLRVNEDLAGQSATLISSAEAQRQATREGMQTISEQTGSLAMAAEKVIQVVEEAALRIEKASTARADAERAAAERAETERFREITLAAPSSRWRFWSRRSGGRA